MKNLIKRYIPQKVDDFINKSSYKNKDHLYVICDMLYRIGIYRKSDNYNGYVDIPVLYFYNIITKKSSYRASMDYLLNNNILICDGIYSKGSKSFGYKFSDEFVSKLVPVFIKSKSIGSRIINNVNSNNNSVNDKYKKSKENFLNNFKIDYNSAKNYIDEWYEDKISYINPFNLTLSYEGTFLNSFKKIVNQYNSYFISISAINDGDLFFRKNNTNGRIDTNLTSLKSELKQFIIGDFYQIDIVNSQPFFLLLDILSTTDLTLSYEGTFLDEVKKYDELVCNGKFYESFEYQYYMRYDKKISRDEIKNMMFCIFYSKNSSYLQLKKVFSSIFPEMMKYINDRKSKKHNELAISMQRLESDMCIETICQELDRNDILYFTIHDAWLVDKDDKENTEKIIIEYFDKKYKKHPKLKIESIKEKKQKQKI